MQKQRLSFKTLILVIGLVGTLIPLLISRPAHATACYYLSELPDVQIYKGTRVGPNAIDAVSEIQGGDSAGHLSGFIDFDYQAGTFGAHVQSVSYHLQYTDTGDQWYVSKFERYVTAPGNVSVTGSNFRWWRSTSEEAEMVAGTDVSVTLSQDAYRFGAQMQSVHYSADVASTLHMTNYQVCFSATIPTITPTPPPTATPTSTATPSFATPGPTAIAGAGAVPGLTCITPNTIDSQFLSGSTWTFSDSAAYSVPIPQRWLDLPPGGSASLPISLSSAQYKLRVIYQASFGSSGGGHIVATVAGLPITIQQPADSAEHTFESEPTRFQSGSALLILSKPNTDTDNVTIKFVCLSVVPTDVSIGQRAILTGGDNNDACATCDPPFSITDIPGILNWIVCNLRRLFTCYFLPMLVNVLSFIGLIIVYILGFIYWITRAAGSIVNWVGDLIGSVWTSLTGWFLNLFVGIINGFQSSGIAQMINTIMAGARDLPTAISNGINVFGGWLSAIFLRPASNLFEFILRLIVFAAGVIAYVIGLIPLVIQSFIDGINSSGTPVSGSPICSDPSSLAYYPCLGFYVLDNTIFAGPAGLMLPVLVGVVVFYNVVWIFTSIKEELSK